MHLRTACIPLALLALATACADRAGREVPTASTAPAGAPRLATGPSPLGPPVPIGIEVVASGFTSPVQLVTAPQKNGRRFVVDQVGVVWELNPAGRVMPKPFLDIRGRITPLNPRYDERGLLGLAFHPDFGRNGRFFVFYTIPPRAGAPAGYNHTNVVSEFRARGGAQLQADPASERVVLTVDHPQANHNGGTVAFGPDGYLYISIGDGGNRDDEGPGHVEDWYADNAGGNGQDVTHNLLGNILRIDVDRGDPYAVPGDNPFVGRPGLDEIWAYGFRNPYRFSFDTEGRRALYVGDAGQELWEEVSEVAGGGNYGWNVREGTHCFDAENPTVSPPSCPDEDPTTGEKLRDPVIEFANAKAGGLSLTVVGGVVYRGGDVPELDGRYVFGGAASSFATPDGRLFVATPQGSGPWPMQELLVDGTRRLEHVVKGFGQDADGEVYVLGSQVLGPTGSTGKVFRIVRPRG